MDLGPYPVQDSLMDNVADVAPFSAGLGRKSTSGGSCEGGQRWPLEAANKGLDA